MPPVKKSTKVKEKAPKKSQVKKVKVTLATKSSKSTKKSKLQESKVKKCKTTKSKEQKSKATKARVQKSKTTKSKEKMSKTTKANVQKAISKKPKAQMSNTKKPKVQKIKKEANMNTPVKSPKKKGESEKKGVKAITKSLKGQKKEKENTPVSPKRAISQKSPTKNPSAKQKLNTALEQNSKIICFSCEMTVPRDSIKSHLFFGPLQCGACYLKISKCVEFAECWHKQKMTGKLIVNQGNNVLSPCTKSQTGIHESLKWEDCINFLRYYIEKDIMISNFCSNTSVLPLAKDIHIKMSEYMAKLSELENQEPWKPVFEQYKNYCKEFEKVLENLPLTTVGKGLVVKQKNIEAKSRKKGMPSLKKIESEESGASIKKQAIKDELSVLKASADQSSPRIKDKNLSKSSVILEKPKSTLASSENKSIPTDPDCNMNKLPLVKRKCVEELPKRKKNGLMSDNLNENYVNPEVDRDPQITVDSKQHDKLNPQKVFDQMCMLEEQASSSHNGTVSQKPKGSRVGKWQQSCQGRKMKKVKVSSATAKASKKLPFVPADDHFLVINYPKEKCPEECPECYSGFIPACVTLSCSMYILTLKCQTCGISIYILHESL